MNVSKSLMHAASHPPPAATARTSAKRRRVLLAQSWWEDRVLRGVAAYAAQHNWELECRMRWSHQIPSPVDWRGDGLIVYTGVSAAMKESRDKLVAFVRATGLPVVETQECGNALASAKVIVPHEAIGRVAAEYLLSLKFRNFGFVEFDDNAIETLRRQGFQKTAEAAGGVFHSLTLGRLAEGLRRVPKPIGLMTSNDANALHSIFACTDAGLRVPEEVAVVGVDDTEIVCDFAAVPLSSVNCNYERQGYEAAALLDRLMNGEAPPPTPVLIPPKGVSVRRSTDTIAIPDADAMRALRFLRDHYRRAFNLEEMAGELGVPLRRIQNGFHRHVGRTLLQELNRLRVEHAKTLLPDKKMKLETIGMESGFSSRFHFVQVFRRFTGETPRAYRRRLAADSP